MEVYIYIWESEMTSVKRQRSVCERKGVEVEN